MLKALMLRRSIDAKKAELAELERKDIDFQKREADLETAINEVEPGNTEQEETVNAEIEAFDTEKAEHEGNKQKLSADIEGLEAELEEIERNAPKPYTPEKKKVERGASMETINIRALPKTRRAFDALPMERRNAILGQDDVKAFLASLRGMKGQSRAVTGAELSIPVVFLELISENMYRYSKLLNRVRVRNVNGEARQTIAGTVPEAIWTEMCGAINELDFSFNQVVQDGYKVSGFVPVCNSILEDNDINLASWIVEMISEAIGLAEDKAPAWVDLHTSNILKIGGAGVTGAEFWSALMTATGATYTKYNRGTMFWAMNSKTYAALKSKLITFTATGDIVANLFGSLPIVTGDIDVLEFMPDGDIVGGYGDLYLWTQRAGMTIEQSREVQFIQDNTVFKGKARADGQPIIPGAFVAININNTEVTTVMDFAADTANDAQLSALSLGNVSISFDPETYSYTATATANSVKVEATPAQPTALVSIEADGKQVRNGGTITLKASTLSVITITVKQGNAVRVYTCNITGASA